MSTIKGVSDRYNCSVVKPNVYLCIGLQVFLEMECNSENKGKRKKYSLDFKLSAVKTAHRLGVRESMVGHKLNYNLMLLYAPYTLNAIV